MNKFVLMALLGTTHAVKLDTCDIDDFNGKYPELFRGSDTDVHPGNDYTSISV
jgi:prolyl oligopeptidase